MNELAIIINKNGEYVTFGKWVPIEIRDAKNESYWHNTSFKNEVYNSDWFNNLGISYNNNQIFTAQLDLLAKQGIITILNIKNDKNSENKPAIQMTVPENTTTQQNNTLEYLKEKLITWSLNNYSYIDMITEDGEYLSPSDTSIIDICDYYNYLEKKKIVYTNKM